MVANCERCGREYKVGRFEKEFNRQQKQEAKAEHDRHRLEQRKHEQEAKIERDRRKLEMQRCERAQQKLASDCCPRPIWWNLAIVCYILVGLVFVIPFLCIICGWGVAILVISSLGVVVLPIICSLLLLSFIFIALGYLHKIDWRLKNNGSPKGTQ